MNDKVFVVDNPERLSSWKSIAKREISRWLNDQEYADKITRETMTGESMGPFTKFLYHFASQCRCAGWGVMIDFNERTQRVFLPDHYYKWMHKLRDEINAAEVPRPETDRGNP